MLTVTDFYLCFYLLTTWGHPAAYLHQWMCSHLSTWTANFSLDDEFKWKNHIYFSSVWLMREIFLWNYICVKSDPKLISPHSKISYIREIPAASSVCIQK